MIPNIKDIKNEVNQNRKHRKISIPSSKTNKHVERPFKSEFENGNFKNDIYYSYNTAFLVWYFIKTCLTYAIPAIVIHICLQGINAISGIVINEDLPLSSGAVQVLILAYGICLFFGLRKVSDHQAYFNAEMMVSKYSINRVTYNLTRRVTDIENHKELTVIEAYRKKFQKVNLFPTTKEFAIVEQLYQYQANQDKVKQSKLDYAALRRSRMSLNNKRKEHEAAKAIADWKQAVYGGVNEYDEIVNHYKNRTTPAVKEIINNIQHS